MGFFKQRQIEIEERGYEIPEPGEKYVCANHFEDQYLQQYIKDKAVPGKCSYCGKRDPVMDFSPLMEYIAAKITSRYSNPDQENLPLGSSYYDDEKEEIPGFQRVGCYIAPCYAEQYNGIRELFDAINLYTDNEELDNDMENCFFNDWWIRVSPFSLSESQELSFQWEQFSQLVKHQQRFTFFKRPEFASVAPIDSDNGLSDILTELSARIDHHKLYAKLPKETFLYRCRFLKQDEAIHTFDQITSPPDGCAKQNRMSPAGVSMFYGAFDQETAILESSPDGKPSDLPHAIGIFRTTKDLTILDLTNLPETSFWLEGFESFEFLHSFNNEITKEIKRDDRIHQEYIPAQVFTEYLRYIHKLPDGKKLDGLKYKSSLMGAKENIVLFYDQKTSKDILDLVKIKQ